MKKSKCSLTNDNLLKIHAMEIINRNGNLNFGHIYNLEVGRFILIDRYNIPNMFFLQSFKGCCIISVWHLTVFDCPTNQYGLRYQNRVKYYILFTATYIVIYYYYYHYYLAANKIWSILISSFP